MAIKRFMPKKEGKRGFALFIAIVFMSVMLLFGLALGSLSYKQQVLASSSVESQYAFYAADAALECTMYYDQQQNLFAYPPSDPGVAPSMVCDGGTPYSTSESWSGAQWVITNRIKFDSNTRCADVVVYKPNGAGLTTVYSQGYDVPCATVATPNNARFVSRGLFSKYSTGTNTVTYATLNPSDKGTGETLSNGNLTATKGVSGWGTGLVRATIGKSSGKWYWEVRLNTDTGHHFLGGVSLSTLAGSYLGIDANGWALYSNDGALVHNAVHNPVVTSIFGTGAVVGYALNMDTGVLQVSLNGGAFVTLASGLSGTFYPAIDQYDSGMQATVNFGATAFTYTPPAGYNAGVYQ
jgi:hypothetical protein